MYAKPGSRLPLRRRAGFSLNGCCAAGHADVRWVRGRSETIKRFRGCIKGSVCVCETPAPLNKANIFIFIFLFLCVNLVVKSEYLVKTGCFLKFFCRTDSKRGENKIIQTGRQKVEECLLTEELLICSQYSTPTLSSTNTSLLLSLQPHWNVISSEAGQVSAPKSFDDSHEEILGFDQKGRSIIGGTV